MCGELQLRSVENEMLPALYDLRCLLQYNKADTIVICNATLIRLHICYNSVLCQRMIIFDIVISDSSLGYVNNEYEFKRKLDSKHAEVKIHQSSDPHIPKCNIGS